MDEISKIIRDIKSLKIQGANDVAEAGVRCLKIAAKKSGAKSKGALIAELEKAAKRVLATRPTEPALKRVVNSVLVEVERNEIDDVSKLKSIAVDACDEYLKKLKTVVFEVGKNGAGEIADGDVVMTRCHSENVVAVLAEAKRQGKKFEVVVTETRPLYQGKITARELLGLKIPVTYSVDSAAGYLMKRATKFLVGCDAILIDGSIVNKIGTLPVAIVAKRFGRPMLVAAESLKITKDIPKIEQRDPKEIIDPKQLSGAKIVNPAFDLTPAEYVTKIITEKGVFRPAEIEKLLL